MGIVLKTRDALKSAIDIIESGDVRCKCTSTHMCKLCEAKMILQDVDKIIASGGSKEGVRPRRRVYCVTTDRVFNSLKEASDAYGVVSATISKACKGQLKFAGKFGNQKLEWKYADDIKEIK